MKLLIISGLSFYLLLSGALADYKLIGSTQKEGLQMDVYAATLLSGELKHEVSIRVFLKNVSGKKMSVLTKFVGGHISRGKNNGYYIFLMKGSKRGIKGEQLKDSLEGRGVVILAPDETTELPTVLKGFEDGQEAERVLKTLSVYYSLHPTGDLDYGNLWRGEMEAKSNLK